MNTAANTTAHLTLGTAVEAIRNERVLVAGVVTRIGDNSVDLTYKDKWGAGQRTAVALTATTFRVVA